MPTVVMWGASATLSAPHPLSRIAATAQCCCQWRCQADGGALGRSETMCQDIFDHLPMVSTFGIMHVHHAQRRTFPAVFSLVLIDRRSRQ